MAELQHWEEDPALYVFTSLTAGSSHVVTATSRIETILRANRIPFSYIDTATNESARKLFQRRGKGKKLPLLVKEGFVLADLEQVEEWNEFGELKDAIGTVATQSTSITTTPAKAPATGHSSTPAAKPTSEAALTTGSRASSTPKDNASPSVANALRQAAFETASAAKVKKATASLPKPLSSTATTAPKGSPTPLSPSKVPLPATPGPLSPGSPISPPPGTERGSPRHRHSGSSGSAREGKQFVPEHYDPAPTSHRGSSVSLASEEEIREIECKETILEESEDEEDEEEGIMIPPVKHAGKETKEAKDSDEEDYVKVESKKGLEKALEKVHLKDAGEKKEE